MANQYLSYVGANANLVANVLAGNVVGGVSNYMGFLSNIFGKKQADPYKQSIKYYDYTRPKEMEDSIKLMKQQASLEKGLMSNSAKVTQNLNQKLMDYQYALERQSRQTSYQDTRMDLEGAGYNPLLAIGQQSNYTPVSSGVSANSQGVEGSTIASNSSMAMKNLSDVRNNTKSTNVLAKAQNYINDLNIAKAELTRSQTTNQDITNNVDRAYKESQALENLELTKDQRRSISQDIAESIKRTENIGKQSELLENQISSGKALAEFYKSHPQVALAFQLMNALSGGNILGTSANFASILGRIGKPTKMFSFNVR